jgi:hypothetical protein
MPLDIIAGFFDIVNLQLFDSISVLLVVSFLIWEIPRLIRIMGEEYAKGAYPDGGRVADYFLLVVGLAAAWFLFTGHNGEDVVRFIKTPGVTAIYLILLATIPLIITLGYVKRFFARLGSHESITVFLVHCLMDLAHTLFFISVSVLAVPVIGFLIGLH